VSRAIRKNWFAQAIGIITVTLLALASLPVLLPYVAITQRMRRKRLQAAAAIKTCSSCGHILGDDALKLADEQWTLHLEQLRREHPNTKFRLVRRVFAICGKCRTEYAWKAGRLEAIHEVIQA
jgi:hypothetical protein